MIPDWLQALLSVVGPLLGVVVGSRFASRLADRNAAHQRQLSRDAEELSRQQTRLEDLYKLQTKTYEEYSAAVIKWSRALMTGGKPIASEQRQSIIYTMTDELAALSTKLELAFGEEFAGQATHVVRVAFTVGLIDVKDGKQAFEWLIKQEHEMFLCVQATAKALGISPPRIAIAQLSPAEMKAANARTDIVLEAFVSGRSFAEVQASHVEFEKDLGELDLKKIKYEMRK